MTFAVRRHVFALRDVKENIPFFTLSKIVNFQPILLKMYTRIAWTYTWHKSEKRNIYVSMATKNPHNKA